VDVLVERLDARLREWKPETAAQVLPRLPFLDRDSVANVQGLASIPTVRLGRKLGKLPRDVMTKLKSALAFALDLEAASQ
jgi:mRNA interferase MazF